MLDKLEKKNFTLDRLREMDSKEIGHLIHHVRAGADVKKAAMEIPVVELEATIQVGNQMITLFKQNISFQSSRDQRRDSHNLPSKNLSFTYVFVFLTLSH